MDNSQNQKDDLGKFVLALGTYASIGLAILVFVASTANSYKLFEVVQPIELTGLVAFGIPMLLLIASIVMGILGVVSKGSSIALRIIFFIGALLAGTILTLGVIGASSYKLQSESASESEIASSTYALPEREDCGLKPYYTAEEAEVLFRFGYAQEPGKPTRPMPDSISDADMRILEGTGVLKGNCSGQ